MSKKIILTGDRPTGKLHIGHYIGSLKNRVQLQESGEYESFIMIADQQALTDNARDPEKIRRSLNRSCFRLFSSRIRSSKINYFCSITTSRTS